MSKAQHGPIKVEVAGFTVSEAARELKTSTTTIYRWLNDGTLQRMVTLGGYDKLASAESVLRLKAEREAQ